MAALRILMAVAALLLALAFHLPGKHNQMTHGRKGKGHKIASSRRRSSNKSTTASKGRRTHQNAPSRRSASGRAGSDRALARAGMRNQTPTGARIGTVHRRRAIAKGLLADAHAAEPAVTQDLKELAGDRGGEMFGLKYRFKDQEGIAGKIIRVSKKPSRDWASSPEDLGSTLGDNLRYTYLTENNERHATDVEGYLGDLKDRGYTWDEDNHPENNWLSPGPYKGINMDIKDPDGYQFELQFHSPESMVLKDLNHGLYEEWRKPETSQAEKDRLDAQMQANSDKVPMPPGIERIGHPK